MYLAIGLRIVRPLMKPIIAFISVIFFSLSTHAQIDSKNKSFSIPATETPKATPDIKPILPKADSNPNNSFGLNIPKKNYQS